MSVKVWKTDKSGLISCSVSDVAESYCRALTAAHQIERRPKSSHPPNEAEVEI